MGSLLEIDSDPEFVRDLTECGDVEPNPGPVMQEVYNTASPPAKLTRSEQMSHLGEHSHLQSSSVACENG